MATSQLGAPLPKLCRRVIDEGWLSEPLKRLEHELCSWLDSELHIIRSLTASSSGHECSRYKNRIDKVFMENRIHRLHVLMIVQAKSVIEISPRKSLPMMLRVDPNLEGSTE